MYLWGNIAPFVISYFYYFGGYDGKGESVSMYDTVIVLPMFLVVLAIVNPIGAFLSNRFNPKLLISIGASLGCLAMVFAA